MSVRDPFQIENDGPDTAGAASDERVAVFRPAGKVPPARKDLGEFAKIIPGPTTKVVRFVATLHDEFLPLAETRARRRAGLAICVGQFLVERPL